MLIEDNPERYELAIPCMHYYIYAYSSKSLVDWSFSTSFRWFYDISDTSRERLPGEEDGVDFFFEKARKMQTGYQRNHFIEVYSASIP